MGEAIARGEHYAVDPAACNFTLLRGAFSADYGGVVHRHLRRSRLLPTFCLMFCGACGQESKPTQPSQTGGASGAAAIGGSAAAAAGAQSTAGTAAMSEPGAGVGSSGAGSGSGGSSTGTGSGGSSTGTGSGGSSTGTGSGGSSTGGAGGATTTLGTPRVYVGSTTGQISIYMLDAAAGKLSLMKSVAAGSNPSFLALDPARAHLYAVNDGTAQVASFAVDPNTGDLTFLNRVASGGATPAFVSVDRAGKYVMVANYDGGTTRVLPVAADGSLGAPSDNKAPGKWSHMILTDPANRFVFVMNKGSDIISQFVFDAAHGTLSPNSVPTVATVAGAGPRHLAFHPNGNFAYVIDETNSTMSAYSYNATLGQLTTLQTLSTLPEGAAGANNTAAEVVVAPSGSFVYGSNRGNDSIVTFSVDSATGKLTYIGVTPSGGASPRSFTLSADGKLMLVANESDDVTSFSVDLNSGALSKLSSIEAPKDPQFVGIAILPGSGTR